MSTIQILGAIAVALAFAWRSGLLQQLLVGFALRSPARTSPMPVAPVVTPAPSPASVPTPQAHDAILWLHDLVEQEARKKAAADHVQQLVQAKAEQVKFATQAAPAPKA